MIDVFEIYSDLWGAASRIVFDRNSSDYLIDDDGLDWGEVSGELSTIKNLDGIGATLNAVETSKPRVISITGWVVGTEAEMETKKNVLKSVLTPNYNLRVVIPNEEDLNNNYYIDTRLTEGLKFDPSYKANNEVMCRFSFALSAAYPFFCLKREYTGNPGFILNLGSVPVGVKIVASMSGTGDIYFSSGAKTYTFGTIDAPGEITVDTRHGARKVTSGNQGAFKYLNPLYKEWIQVPPSLSFVSVGTSGAVISSIEYEEAHIALKGM